MEALWTYSFPPRDRARLETENWLQGRPASSAAGNKLRDRCAGFHSEPWPEALVSVVRTKALPAELDPEGSSLPSCRLA
jgi:hypothetical protein